MKGFAPPPRFGGAQVPQEPVPITRTITVTEGISVKDLAEKLGVRGKDLIASLLMRGVFVTVNQSLDAELVKDVASQFGADTQVITFEDEMANEALENLMKDEDVSEIEVTRPPVVTVMGHVDHGAYGRPIGAGLQVAQIGNQADHLQQQVEVLLLLRRDIDEYGGTSPCFGDQPAIAQLLFHAVGLRIGLVDFVNGNNDRHVGGLGVVYGFERLGHDSVVGCDHDHHDVRDLGTAGTHAGKGLVTRGIEEDDFASEGGRVRLGDTNLVGADVLRDAAGFTRSYVGFTDCVQQ